MTTRKNIRVLIVDDSEDDRDLLKLALDQSPFKITIEVAWNGEAALQHLKSSRYKPHLIFLDLKMPRMSGLEVLREVKSSLRWRDIPVCVFSTSSEPSDVQAAYLEHANAYLEKPVGLDALIKAIAATTGFWFNVVTLAEDLSNG
jgi:CheY-like chemotaxis protein